MAIIKSGDSTSQLHVTAQGAAFTTLLDASGNPISMTNPLAVVGALTIGGSVEVSNDVGNPLPVSGTVSVGNASIAVTGPATDASMRATPLPVSVPGNVVVIDGGGSLTVDGQLQITAGNAAIGAVAQGAAGAAAWKVDGSAVVQPVSATNLAIRALADGTDRLESIVRGGASGNRAEVDATPAALRIAQYPKDKATYSVRGSSGVLAAALAAGAPVFALRAGATPIYITQIELSFGVVVAYTAAQQFALVGERFSAAAMAGGQAYTPMRHRNADTASTVADVRASTTAALTTTGVTFEGFQVPLLGWTAVAAGSQSGPAFIDLRDNPIKLLTNEGFCIRNLVLWPAAGTGVVSATVRWEEY